MENIPRPKSEPNEKAADSKKNIFEAITGRTTDIAAFAETHSKYEGIIGRLSEINNDYSIAATKAISLIDRSFPQTLRDSLCSVSASYSTVLDNMKSLLPEIDKASFISPFLEQARTANIAIQSISSKYIREDFIRASSQTTSYLSMLQEKSASMLTTLAETRKHALFSLDSYYPKMDSAVSTLLNTDFVKKADALRFSMESSFARISECSIVAESSLSRLPWQKIGALSGLLEKNRVALRDSFLDATCNYRNFWESYQAKPTDYALFNPVISRSAPVEHFWNANILEAITVPIEKNSDETKLTRELTEDINIGLHMLLPKLNPKFPKLWDGARQALNTDNPERVRHFTVSIRELFTHVLHSLAPDNNVQEWSKDPNNYYNGKPTRRARLLYICKDINHSSFVSFVNSDVKAILEFIDLFNEGTHAITPSFSENQVHAIKAKCEATLKFLLEIGLKDK